ncbi:hypothetical protein LSAT2_005154 [Lamellibrachia satsuma]|nr:hypothetical protein LSAT2_005154 [Lamellibrachia satsuma]
MTSLLAMLLVGLLVIGIHKATDACLYTEFCKPTAYCMHHWICPGKHNRCIDDGCGCTLGGKKFVRH